MQTVLLPLQARDVAEIVEYDPQSDELVLLLMDDTRRRVKRTQKMETALGRIADDFWARWAKEMSDADDDSDMVDPDLLKPLSPRRSSPPPAPVQHKTEHQRAMSPPQSHKSVVAPENVPLPDNAVVVSPPAVDVKHAKETFSNDTQEDVDSAQVDLASGHAATSPPQFPSPQPTHSPTKPPVIAEEQTRMPSHPSHANGVAHAVPFKEEDSTEFRDERPIEISKSNVDAMGENVSTAADSVPAPQSSTTEPALSLGHHHKETSAHPPPLPLPSKAPNAGVDTRIEEEDDKMEQDENLNQVNAANIVGTTTTTATGSPSPSFAAPAAALPAASVLCGPQLPQPPQSPTQHISLLNAVQMQGIPYETQPLDPQVGAFGEPYQYFPSNQYTTGPFYPYQMIFTDPMNAAPVNVFQDDLYRGNNHDFEPPSLSKTALPLPPDENPLGSVQQAPITLFHLGAPKPLVSHLDVPVGAGVEATEGTKAKAPSDVRNKGFSGKSKLRHHIDSESDLREQMDSRALQEETDEDLDNTRHSSKNIASESSKSKSSKSKSHRTKSSKSSRSRKSKSSRTEGGERTGRTSKRRGLRSGTKLSEAGMHARRTEDILDRLSQYHGWKDQDKPSDDDSDFHVKSKRKKHHKQRSRSPESSQGRSSSRRHSGRRSDSTEPTSEEDQSGERISKMDVDDGDTAATKRGRGSTKKSSSSRRNGSKKPHKSGRSGGRSSSRTGSTSPGRHSRPESSRSSRKKRYKPDVDGSHDRANKRRRKGSRERHGSKTVDHKSSASTAARDEGLSNSIASSSNENQLQHPELAYASNDPSQPSAMHHPVPGQTNSQAIDNADKTGGGDKPYKCPHCYKQFESPTPLKNHQRSHNDYFPCENEECVNLENPLKGVAYETFVDLNKHWRDAHRKPKAVKHMCWICNKHFQTEAGRQRHGRIHGCLKSEFVLKRRTSASGAAPRKSVKKTHGSGHRAAESVRGAVSGPVPATVIAAPPIGLVEAPSKTVAGGKDKALAVRLPSRDADVVMSENSDNSDNYSPTAADDDRGVTLEQPALPLDVVGVDGMSGSLPRGKKRRLEDGDNSRRPHKRPHLECRVCKASSFPSEKDLSEHMRQCHMGHESDNEASAPKQGVF